MSEKVLGIIEANRPAFARTIRETLFFTPDRVIVAKTSGSGGVMFGAIGAIYDSITTTKKADKILELPLEDVLKAHKDKHKWYGGGLSRGLILPETKEKKVRYPEDYENMLRPIFGDRLSVKK